MEITAFELSKQYELYRGVHVHTLIVGGWEGRLWTEMSVKYLLLMCRLYRVEHLRFVPGLAKTKWLPLMLIPAERLPLKVRSVRIDHNGSNIPDHLGLLFANLKAEIIECFIRTTEEGPIRSRARSFMEFLWLERCLERNETVRRIKWSNPDGVLSSQEDYLDDKKLSLEDYLPSNRVKDILKTNQGYKNCQIATMIVLRHKIGKYDVFKIIASMIWETKRFPEWKPM